jgi:hypothetical protein
MKKRIYGRRLAQTWRFGQWNKGEALKYNVLHLHRAEDILSSTILQSCV